MKISNGLGLASGNDMGQDHGLRDVNFYSRLALAVGKPPQNPIFQNISASTMDFLSNC